jgi:hypothetical protein
MSVNGAANHWAQLLNSNQRINQKIALSKPIATYTTTQLQQKNELS